MVLLLSAVFFSLICSFDDWRTRRIPNVLTLPSMAAFIVARGLEGSTSVLSGLQGLVLGALPFYFLFLKGGIGGGDVKMAAAVGAALGSELTVEALFWTGIIGGLAALTLITKKHGPTGLASVLSRTLRLFVSGAPAPSEEDYLPYGLCIAGGTCVAVVLAVTTEKGGVFIG